MRAPRSATVPRVLLGALVAAAAGAVLGGLTSFAQTVLPEPVLPFANSSSGWTLLTVLVVLVLRLRAAPSALAAVLCFAGLTLGYQVVSTARGHPTNEAFFLVVGIVAGPVIGVGAAWLRERGVRAALGAGVLAGVGLGEAGYGLLVVVATTGPVYWILIGVIALALVAVVSARSLDTPRQRLLCSVVALAVAAAFVVAYAALGG